MIPAGGDKSFYDSFKKTEAAAFRKAEAHQANKAPQGVTDKKTAQNESPLRRKGKKKLYTYPIPQGPSERTGDRLQIKCLQYEPPKTTNMTIKTKNAFKRDPNTNELSLIDMDDRRRLKAGEVTITSTDGTNIKHDTPIGVSFEATDANSRMRQSGGLDRLLKYIVELPIPQELSDSNSVTWGEDRVNALEMAALEVAQRAMASEGFGEGARKAATLAVTALNTGIDIPNLNSDTQGAVRAALSGAAVGALGSNVSASSVISRSTGQILNNNLELLFQGVNLRSFPFSVTFSPRSRQESTMVKDIIRRLKQSMAPKTGDLAAGANTGIFLKSPDVFQLRYLKDGHDHPFLNSFKLAALTGMTLNYTNAGTYTSYEDGTPVNIRMNLTFKELNPIYAEDYASESSGPGVGY